MNKFMYKKAAGPTILQTAKELLSRQGLRDMRVSLHDNLINAGQGIVDGVSAAATAPAMIANAAGQRFVKDTNKRNAISRNYNNYINKVTDLNNTVNQYWDERKAADGRDWSKNNVAANVARMTTGAIPATMTGKAFGNVIGATAKALSGGSKVAEFGAKVLAGGHPLSYGSVALQAAPDAVRWIGRTVKGVDPRKTEQIASNAQAARSNPVYNIVSKSTIPGFLYSKLREGLGRSHAQHMMYLLGRPHAYNNQSWYEPKVDTVPEMRNSLDNLYRNNPQLAEVGRFAINSIDQVPTNMFDGVKVHADVPGSLLQPFTNMNSQENTTALNRMLPGIKRSWENAYRDWQEPRRNPYMRQFVNQQSPQDRFRRDWRYRERLRKDDPDYYKELATEVTGPMLY